MWVIPLLLLSLVSPEEYRAVDLDPSFSSSFYFNTKFPWNCCRKGREASLWTAILLVKSPFNLPHKFTSPKMWLFLLFFISGVQIYLYRPKKICNYLFPIKRDRREMHSGKSIKSFSLWKIKEGGKKRVNSWSLHILQPPSNCNILWFSANSHCILLLSCVCAHCFSNFPTKYAFKMKHTFSEYSIKSAEYFQAKFLFLRACTFKESRAWDFFVLWCKIYRCIMLYEAQWWFYSNINVILI